MAVQWNLAGDGFDALQSLQVAGQAQQEHIARQQQAAKLAAVQRQQQVSQQAGSLAASGDYAGARSAALGAGEFDIADHVNGLEDNHRQALAERASVVGQAAISLKGLPAEQRAAQLQAIAPTLAEHGITPDFLQHADLSDAGLDGYINFATSAKDAVAAYHKSQEPYTLNDGDQRYVGGNMLAENAKDAPKPHYIFDSESGSWLLEPGTGGGAPASLPQTGYAPQMGGGGPMSSMLGITAQSESGNRDYTRDGRLITSPAGAQGAMQTLPTTQGNPGYGVAPVRDGSVAEKNRVGRDYLNAMVSKYGDPAKAWAAYNAGPGRVDAAIAQHGDNWLAALPSETQQYVSKNVGKLRGGGAPVSPQNPTGSVINVRAPKSKQTSAPSGYRYNGERLEPIPGGPADPNTSTQRNVQSNRTAEANFRKEFDNLPEVKSFKTARQQFSALRSIAGNPNATAQDDIASIFTFMKTLDPNSTVREGEFATAQNATGVPDSIRNAFNKAQNGQRLNPQQRKQMVETAYRSYKSFRDAYNQSAENYRGYAQDNGISADRVARTYTPDAPVRSPGQKVGRFTITRVQ